MRWPFNRRVDPVHPWGALALAVAIASIIDAVLATIHATEVDFRWWWPTNWMAVPSVIFVAGVILLAVPLRRSSPEPPEPLSSSGQITRAAEAQREITAGHSAGQAVGEENPNEIGLLSDDLVAVLDDGRL